MNFDKQRVEAQGENLTECIYALFVQSFSVFFNTVGRDQAEMALKELLNQIEDKNEK